MFVQKGVVTQPVLDCRSVIEGRNGTDEYTLQGGMSRCGGSHGVEEVEDPLALDNSSDIQHQDLVVPDLPCFSYPTPRFCNIDGWRRGYPAWQHDVSIFGQSMFAYLKEICCAASQMAALIKDQVQMSERTRY